jgi:hypothetical protein
MDSQSSNIVITDQYIVDFFNETMIDPAKFCLLAIKNKDLFLKNAFIHPSENTEKKLDFSKSEIFKIKQEYLAFKDREIDIKYKMNEVLELIESQKLQFLDQHLKSKQVIQERTFKCSYCNVKAFPTKRALAGHTNKCRSLHEQDEDESEEVESVAENI